MNIEFYRIKMLAYLANFMYAEQFEAWCISCGAVQPTELVGVTTFHASSVRRHFSPL